MKSSAQYGRDGFRCVNGMFYLFFSSMILCTIFSVSEAFSKRNKATDNMSAYRGPVLYYVFMSYGNLDKHIKEAKVNGLRSIIGNFTSFITK